MAKKNVNKKDDKKKKKNQNQKPIDVSDVPKYKIKQGEDEKLERWLFWMTNEGVQKRHIPQMEAVRSVEIKGEKMFVSRIPKDGSISHSYDEKSDLKLNCEVNLERISYKDAGIERDLVIKEYMEAQQVGRHLDLLRWNVSKFFLSIQTVFVIVAATGLMELGQTDIPKNKSLIAGGLAFLASFNIVLCVIWWLRNKGIHAWHRTSITRQRLIELDPRLRQTVNFYSTILRRLPIPHGTGELECYGPPFVFIGLWVGVSILAALFSGESIFIIILIPVLVLFVTLLSLFMAQLRFSKEHKKDVWEYLHSVSKAFRGIFKDVTIRGWPKKKEDEAANKQ